MHSDVPILFLTGNEDGADPPANVAHAQRRLPNSRTVLFPAAGHGQLGLPCAQTLIAEFVTRGTATGLDASCAQTAAMQPFDTQKLGGSLASNCRSEDRAAHQTYGMNLCGVSRRYCA